MVLNSWLCILSLSADIREASHEPGQSPLTWQGLSEEKPTNNCVCKLVGYSSDADVTWMVQLGLSVSARYFQDGSTNHLIYKVSESPITKQNNAGTCNKFCSNSYLYTLV